MRECQFLCFNPYIFNIYSGKCSVHSQLEKSMALLLNSRNSPFISVVNYGHPGEMLMKVHFYCQQVSLAILTCGAHVTVTCRISRRGKAEEWAYIQTLAQISCYKLTVREQLNKMNVPSVLQPSAASVHQFRLELGLLLNIQRETARFH